MLKFINMDQSDLIGLIDLFYEVIFSQTSEQLQD